MNQLSLKKNIYIFLITVICIVDTETIFSQKWPGYTLIAPTNSTNAYLLDTLGNTYHTWKLNGNTGYSAHLIPGGTIVRAVQHAGTKAGPVFSITPSGDLHMRYTIRVNNVMWTDDALSQEALATLRGLLNSDSPYIYRGRLESGMGLVSNNVLHDRAAFTDDATHNRHYYRARYFDRLAGTGVTDCYDL
jgi:hypothetical protein